MAHTFPHTLLSDLALDHDDSFTPPAIRASNVATPVPKIRNRRPRNPFIIFRDVFLAANKNMLPSRQTEVSAIASGIWDGLSEGQQLVYKTLARLEREAYERDNPAHAVKHHGSVGSRGSKNVRGRRGIPGPSQSAADLPYGPGSKGIDTQAFLYHAPTIPPAAPLGIPCIQTPASFDAMLYDVHATQGHSMVDALHGHTAQNVHTSYQSPASISVATTVSESFDPQINDHISYYHDTSGRDFAIMNQTVIPHYLPSAPTVAPIAHGQNPVAVSSYHRELDSNTDVLNNGWGEPSTSLAVGSSTYREESFTCYDRPAEKPWDDFQHQLRPPDYSG